MRKYFFCASILLFTVQSVFALAADDGMIARWSFDETGVNQGKNADADRFHAKLSSAFPQVNGIFGKAVDLSGQYQIEIPADVVPEGLKQLAFSAWTSPKELKGYAEIICKEDVGRHGENRLLFAFQNSGNYLTLGLNSGGNYVECDAVIAPEEVLDGQWHFVVGTFDGKFMRLYLDGQEIGVMECQAELNTARDFAPITVNRDQIANSNYETLESLAVNVPMFLGSSSGKDEFFQGKIDDVCFYSRALSQSEIADIYTTGKKNINEPTISEKTTSAIDAAKKLYVKSDSYLKTLLATQSKVAQAGTLNALTLVQLQRLIRNDFPAEVNAYVFKWQTSPTTNMTQTAAQLLERAKSLETAYLEYLPLTQMQWDALSEKDKQTWNRVKEINTAYQSQIAKAEQDRSVLYEIVYEMEKTVELRPRTSEAVAAYQTPQTPPVKDRSPDEARAAMEADWLFQCDNKPTIERSLQEITWSRQLAARIKIQAANQKTEEENWESESAANSAKEISFDAELAKLDELERRAKSRNNGSPTDEDKELYFAVRAVKREITFKNPAIDFDSILYVDGPTPQGSEWNHETRHQLGYMAVPGGRLMTLNGLHPGGRQTKIMPSEPLHGSFWRPDLSYDGKRVLFSFKPHNEKNFHIYEINIDGTGLRQLTGGIFDDLDPVYLPDGKNIMFLTTRGHIYVRCMPPTNAFVMARMALDTKKGDKNLYLISRSGEPEYTPSVMQDGRVIYTRWEYTDKPLWRAQSLWTMNSDGTQVQTFWGNQSVWPDLLKDARQIPGSERVMFTGSAHHNWYSGSVGIIDPNQGFNFPDGLTKVTQEVAWPECGNGPSDPKESENYHTAGNYAAYYSPYPLNEKDFFVSALRKVKADQKGLGNPGSEKFVLLLMDTDGNRELIFEGDHHIWNALPLRPRAVPRVYPDRVNWPTWAERDNPGTGVIYSNNVYENAPEELRNKAKYLRIWSIEHKTYTYWFKRNYVSSGPEISANQSEGIKKIIGTVPIEDDGSVSFNAPTGIALHFQLLDENMRALQTMKSFTGVLPGEVRGCLGCHESHVRTPVLTQTGKALRRAPSNIEPVAWKDVTVSYERYVQPVLDKYCGKCHQDPKSDAYKAFNATLRPGFLGFKEPYMTLLGSPTWGSAYIDRKSPAPFGWADTILVEAYHQRDPAAYATYPPMTRLSYKSRLVNRMASGEHHNVKVDSKELLRVILWVDAMGPYYGAEEVRCMADPIFSGKDWLSQTPRVMTAPIIQRPGPFDPFETDNAYNAPDPSQYNALPVGVSRRPDKKDVAAK
ncbi:MAG: hypothetical protein LBT05_04025 [Planctomycetaceae bacterium]|jgi:hypothetical protein|nr:hypothetical protein [Planctomycetaceae bacterium]